MSDVSIVELRTYDEPQVLEAMRRCLEPLGGMNAFVRDGQTVLLKPNLLGGFAPDRAVTTHPSVVEAAITLVKEAGGTALVGDSPGVGTLAKALRGSRVGDVVTATGARIADFEHTEWYERDDNRVARRIELARAVKDTDVVITLPKLKTHAQMGFTGALKNQFGLVVGAAKAKYHFRLQDRDWLADLMMEINRIAAPVLAIVDAVVGMEGDGPSGGDPREIGALLASPDLAAADTVCCRIVGLDPDTLPLMRAARRYSFGTTRIEDVAVRGTPWEDLRIPDFRHVTQYQSVLRLLPVPSFLLGRIRRHLVPAPTIRPQTCIRCGACADGCPVEPPAIDPTAAPGRHVNHRTCIRCYCCHEFCPVKAIELRPTWFHRVCRLGALVDWLSRTVAEPLFVRLWHRR